jgi:hypothetical protein
MFFIFNFSRFTNCTKSFWCMNMKLQTHELRKQNTYSIALVIHIFLTIMWIFNINWSI